MLLIHLVLGILIATVAWAFVFLIGSSLIIACGRSEPRSDATIRSFDVLIATGAGISCTIFLIFVLATVKLLFAAVILPALVLSAFAAFSSAARRVGRVRVCRIMVAFVRTAAGPGSLAILAVCIVLAVPALLPPSLFDDTMYHLPYALDWARAGGLVVDRYLRFPLAQFNIELLYATFFALRLDAYVQFVTWSFFALTATE